LNEDQKIIANPALSSHSENKGTESEISQNEFTDQQKIEADHHSLSNEDHDFHKYLDKVVKDQMKKSRHDVNEPFNVKLEKFKQQFHQAVESEKK